jgi:hypothetical protein
MQGISISIGVNGNCRYPHLFAGPDNPDSYFASISNHDFVKHNLASPQLNCGISKHSSEVVHKGQ